MKILMKPCDGYCNGELRVIWKNSGGKKFCKNCYWSAQKTVSNVKPTKQKRIPSRSPKRKIKDKVYSKLRLEYLDKHPMCAVNLPGCKGLADQIHHTYSGINRNKYFLDINTWLGVCMQCHRWIHNNPKSARELNYLK